VACVLSRDITTSGTSSRGACKLFTYPVGHHDFRFSGFWERASPEECLGAEGQPVEYFKRDSVGIFRPFEHQRGLPRHNRKVTLLVTRHGLSCTNFVEKFLSWSDIGRRHIADPMLADFGVHGCDRAKDALAALENRPHPDVVLSSGLLRAIETALRVYSEDNVPVVVAPFISEKAGTEASNNPVDQSVQVERLAAALGGEAAGRVTYAHARPRLMQQKPDWEKFKQFIAEAILPDVVKGQDKDNIVIAVVTHSMFLKETELQQGCREHWKRQGQDKALNTQTFQVEYDWDGRWDSQLELNKHFPEGKWCRELHGGLSWNTTAYCQTDVGEWCTEHIQRHASSGANLLEKGLECTAKDGVCLTGSVPDLTRCVKVRQ